ncbi:MAG: hypothetical protein WKF77_28720 [Planctomycetaceae bacterium]
MLACAARVDYRMKDAWRTGVYFDCLQAGIVAREIVIVPGIH